MNGRTVYILGAGCSAKYGYPLAADFLGALKKYFQELENRSNCERLKQCVTNTIALLGTYGTPTIDRLARRIEEECQRQKHPLSIIDAAKSMGLDQAALGKIREAKIATVAMFLEAEKQARSTDLSGYQNLLNLIFEGDRDPKVLESTTCRILNFNYDRLFEIAFMNYFSLDSNANYYGKTWLNSGLDFLHKQAYDIALDRFCFLKLHGTAAMLVAEEHGEPRYGLGASIDNAKLLIDDNYFGPPNRKDSTNPRENPEPLIVFPHEKDRAREQKTSFLYDKYIRAIWDDHAPKVVQDAEQIWVVGYSFDPNDRKSVLQLLRKSADCDIVVQNPKAEEICAELNFRYRDFASRFKPLSSPF